MKAKPIRRQ